MYLVDKSALVRARHAAVGARLSALLPDIATCGVIDLEIVFSARSSTDLSEIREERRGFHTLPFAQEDFDRAIEVLGRLATRGQHRAVGIPDLLIAALAERHGAVVLHYDRDFDLVAAITAQATEWVVAAGSVP